VDGVNINAELVEKDMLKSMRGEIEK